jgi:hypothetical protein
MKIFEKKRKLRKKRIFRKMTKDGLEKEISQENNLLVRPDLVG